MRGQIQDHILHGHEGADTRVALTPPAVEGLYDVLRCGTDTHAGTEISQQPGHLEGRRDALPSHIAQQEGDAMRIQTHDIIQVATHPLGRSGHGRQGEPGDVWEHGRQHLALNLLGHG